MEHENDEIDETLAGGFRVTAAVAMRGAEELARRRQATLSEAASATSQRTAQVEARLAADRALAVTSVEVVHRPDWWDQARPADVGRALETATVWSDDDPRAMAARERIAEELQRRYGIDIDDPRADPAALEEALRQRETALDRGADARRAAEEERAEEARDRTEAARVLTEPDSGSTPQWREATSDELWDTAERRATLAHDLDGVADDEAVHARVLADHAQGRPPHAAPREPSSVSRTRGEAAVSPQATVPARRGPRARTGKPTGQQIQR